MTTITLSNQASFTDFFKKIAAGDIKEGTAIEFKQPETEKEKPFLQIEGKGYKSTINSLVMDALQVHQTNIHKLYSLVTYGEVKPLKASEVAALRIIFQVNVGSSIFNIENLAQILAFITSRGISSRDKKTLVIGLLILFTKFGMDYYFDIRNSQERQLDRDLITEENQRDRDEREEERTFIADEKQLDRDEREKEREFTAEENQRDRDEREKERQFIKEINGCEKIIDGGEEFLEKLTKLSKNAAVVKYLGEPISSVVQKKETLKENRNGLYKILSVNAKKDNRFKVEVENVTTGDSFSAEIGLKISHEYMRPIILNAYLSHDELYLNIVARLVDNKFVGNKLDKATIVSIGEKNNPILSNP